MGDNQLPGREFLLNLHLKQGVLVGDTVVGHKGDAKADVCQIQQQIIASELDFRHQIQLVLLEQVVEEFTGGTFAVQHQDRIIQQIFQRYRTVGEFRIVFPAGDKDIPERVDRQDVQLAGKACVWEVGDDQIHLSRFQKIHALDGSLVGDLDMDVWPGLVKLFQVRDEKIPADRIAGSNPELAAAHGACLQDLRFPAADQIDGRLHMAQQGFSFRGKLYPFGTADEQADAELLFQYFDGLADRRLGDKQLFRCFGKAQSGCNMVKNLI